MRRRVLQFLLSGFTFLLCGVALLLLAGYLEWTPGEVPRSLIPVFLFAVVGVGDEGKSPWVGLHPKPTGVANSLPPEESVGSG